ncbi:MAG: Ig-like domain-containing protein [Dissulfurispiraceae bacterium]
MKRTILLLALLAVALISVSCGGGAGSADTPSGENSGVPTVISLLPTQYIAQTNSYIILYTKVLDGNGIPLPNIAVTFTNLSTLGVLSSTSATTDGNGLARVTLSSTTPGFITIQSSISTGAGQVRDRKTVYFSLFSLALFPTLTLSVDDGDGIFNQPADFVLFKTANDNQRTIRAKVLDKFGQPVVGSTVTFGTDSTEVTFPLGNMKLTDQYGQAEVLIQVNAAILTGLVTTLNITALADNGAFNLLTLFLEPVAIDPNASFLTANPNVVQTNGSSTITAVIKLTTGGPAPDGTAVNFTATCGSVTPFAQTSGGVATATFTAPPTEGTCTINAQVGGVSLTPVNVLVTSTLSVQPSVQTINGTVGGMATFTIFGGIPQYAVFSSDTAFPPTPATVTLRGGTFSVNVPANTTAKTITYTVRDKAGATATATLTIAGPSSLSIQPGAQTINGVSGGIANFSVLGGTPPYSIFGNNPTFAPVPTSLATSGSFFNVTVPAASPNTQVVYTAVDSVGATTTATLTITAPALAVIPSAQTIVGSNPATFTVFGGAPGYTVTSSNPALGFNGTPGSGTWNVAASGGTFTVNTPSVSDTSTVTLTITDTTGTTVTATLTIVTVSTDFYLLPLSATLPVGGSVTFSIFGGTAPYSIFQSGPYIDIFYDAVLDPQSFTIVGDTAGSVTVTVTDNSGRQTNASVTVTP